MQTQAAELTACQLDEMIAERGGVPNIGQITPTVQRHLERRVRRGELAKYRGYWTTLTPAYGFGPLKTIYAVPAFAAHVAEMAAGIAARQSAKQEA